MATKSVNASAQADTEGDCIIIIVIIIIIVCVCVCVCVCEERGGVKKKKSHNSLGSIPKLLTIPIPRGAARKPELQAGRTVANQAGPPGIRGDVLSPALESNEGKQNTRKNNLFI